MKRKDKGGVTITTGHNVEMTNMSEDTITGILKEYRINSCDITFKCNATMDELIDVIEGNRIYVPCIYVLNKIDSISIEELDNGFLDEENCLEFQFSVRNPNYRSLVRDQ